MASNNAVAATAEFELDEDELEAALSELPTGQEGILPALHEAQEMYGYLPAAALEKISEVCETPLSEVVGVATFYDHFSLQPQGDHTIRVCTGTACHVNGADDTLETLETELDVLPGEVTDDGAFTLTTVRCVGACGLAPVVMVDDDVEGSTTPEDVPAMIEKYRAGGD